MKATAETSIIEKNDRQKIAERLAHLQADTYVLYVKTQNFHWNVTDPRFYSLHKFFEKQYEELAEAVDLLAERIRALQFKAPGSMAQFLELTCLEESSNQLSADRMLHQLELDHDAISADIRPLIKEFQDMKDEGTADLLIERLRFHEKSAWMIRSQFGHPES